MAKKKYSIEERIKYHSERYKKALNERSKLSYEEQKKKGLPAGAEFSLGYTHGAAGNSKPSMFNLNKNELKGFEAGRRDLERAKRVKI